MNLYFQALLVYIFNGDQNPFIRVMANLFSFIAVVLLTYQLMIIDRCRAYFAEKHEKRRYVHLVLPDAFIDVKITESLITNKQQPEPRILPDFNIFSQKM